jgi:hypothetical protein
MIRGILGATLIVGTGAVVYFIVMPVLTLLFGTLVGIGGNLTVGTVSVYQMAATILSAVVSSIIVAMVSAIFYLAAYSQKDERDSGALTS